MNGLFALAFVGTSVVALGCSLIATAFRVWSAPVVAMLVMPVAMADMLEHRWDILPSAAWMFILLIGAPLLAARGSRVWSTNAKSTRSGSMGVHRSVSMIAMVAVMLLPGSHGGGHGQPGGHSSGGLIVLLFLLLAAYASFTGLLLVRRVAKRGEVQTKRIHQPLEIAASGASVLSMVLMHSQ